MSANEIGLGMGVTGNAVLLLGYIAGAIGREGTYEFVEAQPDDATQTVRHAVTGNLYRISVTQIEGHA
jgi:hypothetical protein